MRPLDEDAQGNPAWFAHVPALESIGAASGRTKEQALRGLNAVVRMDEQLKTDWVKLLHGLADQLNPLREPIFEKYPAAYYWTCRESEWASDMGFRKAESLLRLMPILVRHSTIDMQCANGLRYFGRKVNGSGEIPGSFRDMLQSDRNRRQEGDRVK